MIDEMYGLIPSLTKAKSLLLLWIMILIAMKLNLNESI